MTLRKVRLPDESGALDLSIPNLNSRPPKLAVGAYDNKPIWEQVIQQIVETRRELSKRLDRIEAVMRENRASLRTVKDRLNKFEPKEPNKPAQS